MANIVDIFIPDLGADKDVDLIEIMVEVGDKVEEEDGLITLETEKASMDVPTTHGGIVKEILVKVGDKMNSGDLIARVEVVEEEASETPAKEEPKEETPAPVAASSEPSSEGDLKAAQAELEAISASGAEVSCQFVNEQTICTVIEEVHIPDLGNDKDVDLIEVMVEVGETVAMEQGLVTLETEKASMEVPAPHGGEILELYVEAGMKVNSGDLVCKMTKTVVVESKKPTPAAVVEEKKEEKKAPVTVQEVAAVTAPVANAVLTEKSKKVYASPSVRKVAREFGVDLGFVKGSGRKGRILKDDIKAYVKEQLSKPAVAAATSGSGLGFNLPEAKEIDFSQFGDTETVELSRIQKISGPSLHRNALAMPHVTQFDEADITEMESFRKAQNAIAVDYKLSPLVFVLKAVAKALEIHPKFNTSLTPDGQSLVYKKYFHIAVAVDTPNGLVVPVIRDVDKKGFKQLAEELKEISQKARDGKLKSTDMQGACFTISSLGGIGGTKFTPIINAPEVAILGLSKSEMKPVWDGENFAPRLMLPLSLSYDHKVIDGADGARFTTTLSKLLSDIRLLSL
ncbi:acetyltransferase component of pyruvate dehydrogenase complex [Malaciobacter pacificus]|uniref:Acetyltransferase component of pyruvate dehydrogenase complex n=1 Tax=Malaciobacter pacificus TaxID=1080223 RepID=A0A5C2HCQ7_9BACT|nr:dihydrolipoyllysine-residue acetyltransferase [Malaciobacter pacificus]QEP35355.1 pyruvate dehydrogenase multienzyme complex, E2 component dihydrolipoyl transacetylase [Malaciobacter pacificus]GGD49187.1 acetyltransferase component of pyruvate dehydrogenase complex [Malaciobacter pacificus]